MLPGRLFWVLIWTPSISGCSKQPLQNTNLIHDYTLTRPRSSPRRHDMVRVCSTKCTLPSLQVTQGRHDSNPLGLAVKYPGGQASQIPRAWCTVQCTETRVPGTRDYIQSAQIRLQMQYNSFNLVSKRPVRRQVIKYSGLLYIIKHTMAEMKRQEESSK